jgi:hypothetical protein
MASSFEHLYSTTLTLKERTVYNFVLAFTSAVGLNFAQFARKSPLCQSANLADEQLALLFNNKMQAKRQVLDHILEQSRKYGHIWSITLSQLE